MTQSDQIDSLALTSEADILWWPRTEEGHCSCPYCTAIREGRVSIPKTQSPWAQRMGRPEVVNA